MWAGLSRKKGGKGYGGILGLSGMSCVSRVYKLVSQASKKGDPLQVAWWFIGSDSQMAEGFKCCRIKNKFMFSKTALVMPLVLEPLLYSLVLPILYCLHHLNAQDSSLSQFPRSAVMRSHLFL